MRNFLFFKLYKMENCQIIKLNDPIKVIGNNTNYIIKKKIEEKLPGSFYNIEIPIINIQDTFTVKPCEIFVINNNNDKSYNFKLNKDGTEIPKDIIIYYTTYEQLYKNFNHSPKLDSIIKFKQMIIYN